MGRAIGIDLGTTYSAVAILQEDGKPSILPNIEGQNITPSVVLFPDAASGSDEPLVGDMAKHSVATAPLDVVQFVKRQMGDPNWRFESANGHSYTAEEVSAVILKKLKNDAEIALGQPITDAVITVPAYFDDARRTATRQAGQIAGLNVLRVLNEPTAAAMSYGLSQKKNGTVLVYDLGGGTFDVTIMDINDGEFDVLATDGNRNLGGFDFDNRIAEYVFEQIKEQGIERDVRTDDALVAEIREKSEIAKKSLTTVAQATIMLTVDGKHVRIKITRDEFESRTEDLLNTTKELVEDAMESAGKSWSDIDERLQGVRRCAGRDHAGAACDQRDAQQVFIEERSFCIKTVLTEQITVVGCKDNERILCESERVEVVEDFADIFVHQGNHTVVNFHIAAGIAVGADMAVHAVHQIAAFFIGRKVGMLLLGQLVLAGAVFMLAGHDRRKGKFSALIHGVPWGRSKIVGMRIEKARP